MNVLQLVVISCQRKCKTVVWFEKHKHLNEMKWNGCIPRHEWELFISLILCFILLFTRPVMQFCMKWKYWQKEEKNKKKNKSNIKLISPVVDINYFKIRPHRKHSKQPRFTCNVCKLHN